MTLSFYTIIWTLSCKMNFKLVPVCEDDISTYIKDMQEAFQMGAGKEFDDVNVEILPEEDIIKSLSAKGSIAYKAVNYLYQAVENPLEGTMITVIKDWASFLQKNCLIVCCQIDLREIGR